MHHSSPNRYALTGFAISLLTLLGLYLAFSTMNIDAAPLHQTVHVQTLQSDAEGVNFNVSVPNVSVSPEGVVTAPGLDARPSEMGAPNLPYATYLIALPPNATAQFNVQAITTDSQSVSYVQPVATVANNEKLVNGLIVTSVEEDLGLAYEEDVAIYSADSFYPTNLYSVSDYMYLGDLRVIELTLYPLSYNNQANILTHVSEIAVEVTFSGSKLSQGTAASSARAANISADTVLNASESAEWHALPTVAPLNGIRVPLGAEALKIEVNQDGIYELTYTELQNAGMNVASVDPNSLQMMHRGENVAYEFVGNSNAIFEPNEKVRFYGWAFDGSSYEKQFIGNNIFWIWANGSPTALQTLINPVGYSAVTTFPESLTFEENNMWLATYTNNWPNFEVTEPDTWYWDEFLRGVTRTYSIDLPFPATVGTDATFSAEVFSALKHNNHRVHAGLNGVSATKTWNNVNAVSITQNVPLSALNNGNNAFTLYSDTVNAAGSPIANDQFYTNRITVNYLRQLVATSNMLQFGYDTAGNYQFDISGFTGVTAADMLVWDISDRLQPKQITIASSDITGSSVRIGTNSVANSKYIATTASNATATNAVNITKYVGSSIEPTGNGAEWVAIAHNSLMAQTNRLANHRAIYSNLTTHVIDVNDVYMQWGYGFVMPQAIQDYMKHAINDWAKKPQYLTIAGDATHNPLLRPCTAGCNDWSTTEETLVVTDLLVADRFLGLIPTDHTFATLVGTDILPDISVGRIASKTAAEMTNTVDKIIEYDNSVKARESWTQELLFLADNKDQGGDFCSENANVAATFVPSGFNNSSYCLDKYLYQYDANGNQVLDGNDNPIPLTDSSGNPVLQTDAKNQMRAAFYQEMGTTSSGIVNYRGHGSIDDWAAGLVSKTNDAEWINLGKPTVILSADCLDGNFAWPDRQALSETFMALDNVRGSAAHWSSSGLGYSFEHTALHTQFYAGLYGNNLVTIGDAITFSKMHYIANSSGDLSEVYAFTLQGDPAMNMPQVNSNSSVYLPILVR